MKGIIGILLLSYAAADCERNGLTYTEGARHGTPLHAACSDFFTTMNVYEVCGPEGVWMADDETTAECVDGEKCEIRDGIAGCVPATCEGRDGTLLQLFERERAPERDGCLSHSASVVEYDVCSLDGGFAPQVDIVPCDVDEHCIEGSGCIPIQCERQDGTLFGLFDKVRAPERDECVGNSVIVAYDQCSMDGVIEHEDRAVPCPDGLSCVSLGTIVGCLPREH